MGRKRNYRESYKHEAVTQSKASGNVSQTARALGISNKSLHNWIKDYSEPLNASRARRNWQRGCANWSGS